MGSFARLRGVAGVAHAAANSVLAFLPNLDFVVFITIMNQISAWIRKLPNCVLAALLALLVACGAAEAEELQAVSLVVVSVIKQLF